MYPLIKGLTSRYRLCYVWYIVEQEISLFLCVPSTISFFDLRCPMPVSDEFFLAETEEVWRSLVEHHHEGELRTGLYPLSLATFYWQFLRHDFMQLHLEVTPLQLRLLLCTIQTQVAQFAQTNRFLHVEDPPVELAALWTANALVSLRREELQNLLVKWHILKQRVFGSRCDSQEGMSCTLMYHLIWMELLICYNDVQLVAGKEGHVAAKPLMIQLTRWASSSLALRAIAHAGQVLKTLQLTKYDALRPVWWPIAVSRVALVMWCYSVGLQHARCDMARSSDGTTMGDATVFIPLNAVDEDFETYGRIIQPGEGVPCIHDSNGHLIPLNRIHDTLDVCMDLLERGKSRSSPICESVYRFLQDIKRYDISRA